MAPGNFTLTVQGADGTAVFASEQLVAQASTAGAAAQVVILVTWQISPFASNKQGLVMIDANNRVVTRRRSRR
jgi:hypothetical protein